MTDAERSVRLRQRQGFEREITWDPAPPPVVAGVPAAPGLHAGGAA